MKQLELEECPNGVSDSFDHQRFCFRYWCQMGMIFYIS
jgi:hypothetical protein